MRIRDLLLWRDVAEARLFPLALASIAAVVTSGCSFSDFTKTTSPGEPACTNSLLGDAAVAKPAAHWTFKYSPDASTDGSWPDSVQQLPLTPKNESDGGALPSFSSIRVNGEGQAIEFDGHQYAVYTGSTGDTLFPNEPKELTVSAWISLPAGGITTAASTYPFIWPIISTLDDATCPGGGYQLDLRVEDPATGPELVFSYQYIDTTDGGTTCGTHRVAYPIDNAPWAWGTGRWHHVAASYRRVGSNQAGLTLYWDGVRAKTAVDAVFTGQLAYSDYRFYLGANAERANTDAPKFKGTIDEIAVFDAALDDSTLRDFVAATSTRPGPSGCRWNTYEQWDKVAQFPPSLSIWASESTSDSLKVNIHDSDWGAGFVSAQLSPTKDLRGFGTAHLDATIPTDPKGGNFQFSLAHGNDFCTWLLPADSKGSYDIDLSRPSSCTVSTCQFPVTSVEWARVSSDWKDAAPAPLQIAVRGLEFRPEGNRIEPSTFGGAFGPRGWCWRPAAFELDGLAWLTGAPTSNLIAATLTGPTNSGSKITADFGALVLDLSNCDRVQISGKLPQLGDVNKFSFALQDINGAWADWDITDYGARLKLGTSASSASDDTVGHPYKKFDFFRLSKVNQISIQKPWGYSGSVNVEISDIQFEPQGCEVWGAP